MEDDRMVMCPLVDEMINDIECIETADAVAGIILEQSVPDKFKNKENWKDICKKCRWHNY